MYHVGTSDIERIGSNVIILIIYIQSAVSERNVMYFITAAAVAVGGERLRKPLKDNIQCSDRDAVQRKADIQVSVECFQKIPFFLPSMRRMWRPMGANE